MKHISGKGIRPFDFKGLEITDYGPSSNHSASVALIKVPPGARHPKARSTKSDKYYYCLAGPIAFKVEGQSIDLLPSDLLVINPGEWFSYVNGGDMEVKLLLIHTPPFDLESEEIKD